MLREMLSNHWRRLQEDLFPEMEEELGPLSDKHRSLAERRALARAFVAKAIFNLPTTPLLIDILKGDTRLRRFGIM